MILLLLILVESVFIDDLMHNIKCLPSLLLSHSLSACSPSYCPTRWAVPERSAFLHTVCLCFSSSCLQTPSLSRSLCLCPLLCSHADPPVHLTTQMATGTPDSMTPDNITTQRTIFVRVLAGLVLSEVLTTEGKGWAEIFSKEYKPKHEEVYKCCTHKTMFSTSKCLYLCSGYTSPLAKLKLEGY